jgi:hypothetical protein
MPAIFFLLFFQFSEITPEQEIMFQGFHIWLKASVPFCILSRLLLIFSTMDESFNNAFTGPLPSFISCFTPAITVLSTCVSSSALSPTPFILMMAPQKA